MNKKYKILYLCYYQPFPTNPKELRGICKSPKELKQFMISGCVVNPDFYVVDKIFLSIKNLVKKIKERIKWEQE